MLHRFFTLIIIAFTVVCSSCNNTKKENSNQTETIVDTVVLAPTLLYEIPVDSFIIETQTVRRNQFMSSILQQYNVNYGVIDDVARNFKDVFDVRRIRVGNHYTAFLRNDSSKSIAYFVYEKNLAEYIVYDFTDSKPTVTCKTKEIRTERRVASGVITSSLWNAMVDNNINPMVAMELSDIYAWSIDFFGIAKNDMFKVIYEEAFVDTISLGIKSIEGAVFKHKNQNFYAIPFIQEGEEFGSFYDEDGNSLKKAFLKAPLKYSRISSGFSNNRFHPVLKKYRAHHGIDYAAASGTPVQSIGDGLIIKKAYQRGGGGNYLKIKHNSVYTTVYMHLKGYAKGIAEGKRVKQGQIIGYVGMTGIATGPHLDFRVFKNGTAINPLSVKAPPVKPVDKANMAAFKVKRQSIMKELRSVEY